jgi:hypothetical protein
MLSWARFAFAAAVLLFAAVLVALFQTIDPTISYSLATVVPLAVPTRVAWEMLGISNAYGYKLLADGELDSYLEGRVRKVVVASLHAYMERKLAAAKKDKGPPRTEAATAASVARRAKRKATAAPGPIAATTSPENASTADTAVQA